MVTTHLSFALVIAILLMIAFSGSYRRNEAWKELFLFFIVVFLASWAGGLWITPIGPLFYGASPIPFIVMGLLFALLLASNGPSGSVRIQTPKEVIQHADEEATTEEAVSALVWFLVILLVLSIVTRYMWLSFPVV